MHHWIGSTFRCIAIVTFLFGTAVMAQSVDSQLQSALAGALSGINGITYAAPVGTNGAASETITPWSIHTFTVPTAWRSSAFTTLPLLAAPICAAYHTSSAVALQATLADLASMITDSTYSTELAALSSKSSLPSSTVRIVLAQSGASTLTLLGILRAQVSGFASLPGCSSTTWPTAAYNNPRVYFAPGSDVDVISIIKSLSPSIGFAPLAYAPGLPCMQIRIQNPTTLEYSLTQPRLGSANSLFVADFTATPPTISAQVGTYPLVGPLLLTLNLSASCVDTASALQITSSLYSDATVLSTLLPWGFARLDDSVQLSATRLLFSGACPPAPQFRSGGSTAIALAVAAWSTQYLGSKNIFASYVPTSSGSGLAALASGSVGLAASDSLFTAAQFQTNTTTKFVPAVAFAVTLVFNLPAIDSLSVPRCTVLGIFNGSVTYWDDPSIVAANPAVSVPHLPVYVVGRSGTSGTTSVLTTGLANLAKSCGVAPASIPSVTSSFSSYVGKVNLTAVGYQSSTTALVNAVAALSGAMGYAAQPETLALSATALSITDPATSATVTADVRYVSSAMAGATYDRTTGGVAFPVTTSTYPFIGTTYFVYRTDTVVPCTEARLAADWMLWALTSTDAATAATTASYVTPTSAIATVAIAAVRATMQCGGQLLYPAPTESTPFPVYAPIIAGVVLIAILLVVARHFYRLNELSHVPRDPDQPFTAMFVGVKNLAALRDSSETATATAMVTFAALVRAAVRDTQCVEVHRLNAGTFLVVALEPHRAIACGVRILQAVTRTPWKVPSSNANRGGAAASESQSTELSKPSVQARPRAVKHDEPDDGSQRTRNSSATGADFIAPTPNIGIHHDLGHLLWPDEGDRERPIGFEGFVVDAAALIADTAAGNQIAMSTSAWELAEELDRVGLLSNGITKPLPPLTTRDMKRLMMSGGRGKEVQSINAAKQMELVAFEPEQVTPATTAMATNVAGTDGTYGVAAALHDKKLGVANRRVAVAVIHIPALRRSQGMDEADAVAKAEAALEMVQEAAHQCRVKILSVVDGTITVVADSATVPQPALQAASIAFYCAVELPDIDRALAGCSSGVACGVATIGKVREIDVLLGNVCATAKELQQCAEQAQVGCVLLGKTLLEAGLRQRFLFSSFDVIPCASSETKLERLVALTDTIEEATFDQLQLEASDPSSWLYHTHPPHTRDAAEDTNNGEDVPSPSATVPAPSTMESAWIALQQRQRVSIDSVTPAGSSRSSELSWQHLQVAATAVSIDFYAQSEADRWRLSVSLF